jgi:dipeptidase E
MRLYLSSFRLGAATDRLVELVRRSHRLPIVGIVANAIDSASPEARAEGVASEIAALSGLGLISREIDLRKHRRESGTLERECADLAALWVRGGNVFALRAAMAHSGADQLFARLIEADALAYAGYSAGPCVLAPSLRGLDACDDPLVVRRMYGEEPVWDGLGVLDRPFVPHLDSPGHPETEVLGGVAATYDRDGTRYWALRDGEVLVVDGGMQSATVL